MGWESESLLPRSIPDITTTVTKIRSCLKYIAKSTKRRVRLESRFLAVGAAEDQLRLILRSLQWSRSQLPPESVFALLAVRAALARNRGSWISNNPITVDDKTVIDVKADVVILLNQWSCDKEHIIAVLSSALSCYANCNFFKHIGKKKLVVGVITNKRTDVKFRRTGIKVKGLLSSNIISQKDRWPLSVIPVLNKSTNSQCVSSWLCSSCTWKEQSKGI